MLTELSKTNAPSLLLHEFNYYFNKAINQYINKRYNIYDVNQQTTDDLRVLKATAILDVNPIYDSSNTSNKQPYGSLADISSYMIGKTNLFGATYEVILPDDYLHMLNCICIYKMAKSYKCYDKDNYVDFAATRLTADSWSAIINDYYHRPLPDRPYYYIHNVNNQTGLPTNPLTEDNPNGTDISVKYEVEPESIPLAFKTTYQYGTQKVYVKNNIVYQSEDGENPTKDDNGHLIELKDNKGNPITISQLTIIKTPISTESVERKNNSNFPRVINLSGVMKGAKVDTVEKDTAQRYGNASKVRCEIRYGRDNSVFVLEKVFIDYIKAPQYIRLTKEQVDLTEDTSQIMEFPDYVCQEIINELTTLIMQRDADPRLQTQTAVTQSIANPAQQQTPQPQQRGN